MNILIIVPSLPFPPDTGGNIRVFNLVKRLSRNHRIALVSFIDSSREAFFVKELKKYCSLIETVISYRRSKWSKLLIVIRCLLTKEPMESRLAYDKTMAKKIQNLLTTRAFDIVHIEHTYMAAYINMIPKRIRAKKVISIQNIGSIQYRRMFKIEKRLRTKIRWLINWKMMKNWEINVLKNFDECLAVSSLDKQYLHSACPDLKISVIENGVDVELYRPLSTNFEKKNVLFLGLMSYEANSDGALYFCSKILPLIKKHIPQCKFFIVGKNPGQALKDLSDGENVIVTGYVDDPVPYYQRCDISVIPLRAGGGSRLKILEAMAVGRPVVSTSIGCEGLEVIGNQHILIADSPEEFANKTVQLLTDDPLYNRIVRQARKLVEERYSWDRISENLVKVYSD